MARIAGVDIPKEKRVEIALTYIFGIGRAKANSRNYAGSATITFNILSATDIEVTLANDEVTYNGDNFNYYFGGYDTAGVGLNITGQDELSGETRH